MKNIDNDMGENIKAVIHAATPEALQRARNNAVNMAKHWPNSEVEIVVNGPAVPAAIEHPHATDACLRLCENSIERFGVEVPETLKTVPAAIVWIIERQKQGWHYVSA